MRDFFGTATGICIRRREPVGSRGEPRHFDGFSHAIDEVIEARIWGGIHFRKADVAGAELGAQVARWERRHYFRRVRGH